MLFCTPSHLIDIFMGGLVMGFMIIPVGIFLWGMFKKGK